MATMARSQETRPSYSHYGMIMPWWPCFSNPGTAVFAYNFFNQLHRTKKRIFKTKAFRNEKLDIMNTFYTVLMQDVMKELNIRYNSAKIHKL